MTPRLGGLALFLLAKSALEGVDLDFRSDFNLVDGFREWSLGDGDDGWGFALACDCASSADSTSESPTPSSNSLPLSLLSRRRLLVLGAGRDTARPPLVSWTASES